MLSAHTSPTMRIFFASMIALYGLVAVSHFSLTKAALCFAGAYFIAPESVRSRVKQTAARARTATAAGVAEFRAQGK
jgi:hypothetical protein